MLQIIKNPTAKSHSRYYITIECVLEEKLNKDCWWNKNDSRIKIMSLPNSLNVSSGIIAGFSIGSAFKYGSDPGTITFEKDLETREQRTWIVALLGKEHPDYWRNLDVDHERLVKFFQEIECALPPKPSIEDKLNKTDPLYKKMRSLEEKPKTKQSKEEIKFIRGEINKIQQDYLDSENFQYSVQQKLIIENGIKLAKELRIID